MARENHPVWDVYDLLRTARLNELYYGIKLQAMERLNLGVEIGIAVVSSSSAVGGLAVWKTTVGNPLWQVLLGLAALLTIVKPLLGLPKKIKAYEELLAGYRLLAHELRDLRMDISQGREYTSTHQARCKRIKERVRDYVAKNPERIECKKTKAACTQRVLEEIPSSSLFIPGESK
ncbi:hypothetical protein YA0871_21015 [Pseudomonas paralactis]|uniref:SMODS and SLOG-associating 2TM effector domain-containing protein n=1 Tax=Pseudomonas paralactis TaxID=1615673 RepID=A0ABS0V4C9_9PSED|nr:hypothetical protein [Pseudomonas paralactis]MBI6635145.1 hypothetical protein [Pseudomonas paralactis]